MVSHGEATCLDIDHGDEPSPAGPAQTSPSSASAARWPPDRWPRSQGIFTEYFYRDGHPRILPQITVKYTVNFSQVF